MRDCSAVYHRQGPSVRAIEQDADGLHRRHFPAFEIGRETREHLARHVAAAIDGTANDELRGLVAQKSVDHFGLRPTMRPPHRGNQDGELEYTRDRRAPPEVHDGAFSISPEENER